ncbi:dienelactone hydrolase family protein [Mycobacterium sp. CVI_P3]|uniref:Dienelactone hydrolase family protein n=1 Tax=Mycobacterium pinniadriaticum TaxID=2994102 RepID=A0ABT3SI25_9MYCO|nr:dienelactone hydrolase family protein [Mycobacterium pinniadriaticum]MCX2932776.1 dienelactone hydrolase family protein [Mycobacterium pinniadriaticum]MCX2939164.1 dienelactone hydrolase family protein [Mycobacterium pinniadriaticum]
MSDVTIPAVDGSLRGYLAIPDGDGPWPGVVVVHDVLGMTADLKRITDRFAASGYLAIAPSLYDGPRPKIKCVVGTVRAHFTGRGLSYDNLLAAREYLISDSRCTGRVGLAGFCMGAGFCLQLAPGGLFDATAPSYAILPKDADKLEQSCPVVGSFGAKDPIVARDTADKLEAVLTRGDVPHDIKKYPRAGHSFMNEHPLPAPIRLVAGIAGIAYSAPEAEDAWQRILAFFAEHLAATGKDLDSLDRI